MGFIAAAVEHGTFTADYDKFLNDHYNRSLSPLLRRLARKKEIIDKSFFESCYALYSLGLDTSKEKNAAFYDRGFYRLIRVARNVNNIGYRDRIEEAHSDFPMWLLPTEFMSRTMLEAEYVYSLLYDTDTEPEIRRTLDSVFLGSYYFGRGRYGSTVHTGLLMMEIKAKHAIGRDLAEKYFYGNGLDKKLKQMAFDKRIDEIAKIYPRS